MRLAHGKETTVIQQGFQGKSYTWSITRRIYDSGNCSKVRRSSESDFPMESTGNKNAMTFDDIYLLKDSAVKLVLKEIDVMDL